MATYYGYAERNAEDQIDWNAVGKSMTDTLNAEQKRRDDLKAEIDKDSFEYGQTLSNSPQGEHKGMNEYSLNYASDAQDYNLMQLRLLKSGKIKLRDYLKGRENIKQGTTQIFDMMKNYQEKYGEYAERAKTGVSGMYEGFLLGEVEGFGNLTSTMPYINPTTGKVSIGKKVPKNPNKPYDANTNPYTVKMSDNPSDFRTVQELAFALSSQVDRFDSAGAIDGIVDNFAKKFDTLKKSGSASTKIDDVRNMPDFNKSLDDMIIAEFESNPLNALSALGDFIKYGPDGELIQLTRNPEEQDEHTILLVPNPEQPEGGIAMPDFTSESGKKLLEHMREKIATSVDAGLNRTIEYQRGFQPQQRRASDGPTKKQSVKIGDMLSKLRSGSPNDIKAAEEYFVNTTKGKANAVLKLERNNDGVSITYANGNTQDISFKDQDGNIKSNVQWIESSASAIGGTDDLRAARSGGSKFNNSDFTNLKEDQIIEHGIKLAESEDDQAMDYYNQEKNNMVVDGKISASRILKFGSKFGVPVSKGKSEDGTEEFYFVGSGRDPISIQITQGGKKLPITKYIYDLQNAVIGAIDEDDIVTGYKKASPSGTGVGAKY